jgi:hypothetical protein
MELLGEQPAQLTEGCFDVGDVPTFLVVCSSKAVRKRRFRCLGGLCFRPHTHGLALRFSCRVATLVA